MFEEEILKITKGAIAESIKSELIGYNKPLSKLSEAVLDKHSVEIFNLLESSVIGLVRSKSFKDSIKEGLEKKLASVLVARIGGELEKRVNELKSNPETRARITLAIAEIIKEL